MSEAPQHVVVTVHGIRTFGQWQVRLRKLLKEASPDTVVVAYQYGYFSVLAFVVPIFRWLAVRAFRRKTKALARAYPGARFSFVAHSFGTHLVAYGLRSFDPAALPKIDTIILSGSVLRSQFDWDRFLARIPARRIVNDCGIDDAVLVISQLLVLFTGMAGRVGFYGFSGGAVSNRFFAGGHSHYFQPVGLDADAFMRRNWVALLTSQGEIDWVEERPVLTPLAGVRNAVMRVADPLKIAGYGLVCWLALDVLYLQPRLAAQTEQAAREIAAAANLLDADRSLPDAFASLSRLLSTNAIPAEVQKAEAENVARFALQRLVPLEEAYARIPDGHLFRWAGTIYLKAAKPIRLDMSALSYVALPALGRLVVVAADSTVSILDSHSGRTLAQEQFDSGDGGISGDVDYYSLPASPTKVGLGFFFDDPNADGGHRWAIGIDLSASKLESLGNGLTASADCTDFRGRSSDDDEDLTDAEITQLNKKLSEERRLAEKCLVRLLGFRLFQLEFPTAVPEARMWKTVPDATKQSEDEDYDACASLSASDDASVRIRQDLSTLDFSNFQEGDAQILEQRINNPDMGGPGCVFQFGTKEGKQFILSYGMIGQWHVGYILCELAPGDRVVACVYPSFAWNGSGDLLLSDDGRFLTLAGYGSREGSFWSLIDLERMEIVDPEETPRTGTVGTVIGERSDVVMVATLVPDQPGAIETWFYRIGTKPVLAARRVFEAPPGFATTDDKGNNLASGSIVFRSAGNFILATPFQQVFAMRLDEYGALPGWLTSAWSYLSGRRATTEIIGLVWATPESGFSAITPVKYALAADESSLIPYSSGELRLMSLINGQFLSPPIDLTRLTPCSGFIRDVEMQPQGNVVARLDGCIASRGAPVPMSTVRRGATKLGDYLGEGDDLARRLPGEEPPPS